MQTLTLTLTAVVVVLTGSGGPELPPSASDHLRDVLSTDGAKLDGRLVLDEAMLGANTVTVSYAANEGADAVITVVLGHPSRKVGGDKAGPFVILEHTGEDKAAVSALVARLTQLNADDIWRAAAETETEVSDGEDKVAVPERPAAPISEAEKRAVAALWKADHTLLLGDEAGAREVLDALLTDAELPSRMLLEVAERYRRAKALDQSRATLDRWREATVNDITSPIDTARSVILSGGDVSTLKVLQNARVSGNECGFEKLAESMDAMGHRTEGYALLDAAARKTDCFDVEATMLEWFVADGRVAERDSLSAVLAEHAPDNERVMAIRAVLLLATEQYMPAVDLLEPVVKRDPASRLLGPYIQARMQLVDSEESLEALDSRSDENTEDTLTALVAACAHQVQGDDVGTTRYLQRTGGAYETSRVVRLVRARLAFNGGDRDTVARRLDEVQTQNLPADRGLGSGEAYALLGELLRWTDTTAARATLRKVVLSNARIPQGPGVDMHRIRAQMTALDACIEQETESPCPGPFLYPRGDASNTELGEAESDDNPFGNGLMIFGVLMIFLVIVRQARVNKQRSSRWK